MVLLVVLALVGCSTLAGPGIVVGEIGEQLLEDNGPPDDVIMLSDNYGDCIYYKTLLGFHQRPNGYTTIVKWEIFVKNNRVVSISRHEGINP